MLNLIATFNPGSLALSQPRQQDAIAITATAYCLPGRTASGPTTGEVHRKGGCIALSRDLERDLGVKFGSIVELPGVGRFIFADRMPATWRGRPVHRKVDVYHPTYQECMRFGTKRVTIRVLRKEKR
jgi:3D (Asp-Asp-Asp) domain-containing protein